MTLTTTQHSAYAELLHRGRLYPQAFAFDNDGKRQFTARTLRALVDAGLAKWDGPRGSRTVTHIVKDMGRATWTPEEALINVIHTAASNVAYGNPDDLVVLPNACPPIPGEQDDDDLRAVAAIDVFRHVVNQYANLCTECSVAQATEYGMCDSCQHDARRSGWEPGGS